jgi:putative photosynthetic complex assembly protein
VLWGALALIAIALLAAGVTRRQGAPDAAVDPFAARDTRRASTGAASTSQAEDPSARPKGMPARSVVLAFEDRADGAVVVRRRAAQELPAVVLAPGTGGFIRGVLRGLVRERRLQQSSAVGPDAQPFVLESWRSGRLTLTDTATQRTLELRAFGSTNAAAFEQLLP